MAAALALVSLGPSGPAFAQDQPDPKKVVVCKFVGTPPGTQHHVIIVSENSLNNTPYVAPPDGDSWTDAHGQTTEGSIAIRYANDGEQAKDVSLDECGFEEPEPDVCPPGSDKAGDEIPEGEGEEFCDEDDEEPPPGPGDNPGDNPNNNPGDSPDNSPNSPGVTVAGAEASAPTAASPSANVPTAVAAGLAPTERELSGAEGSLGLLGMATVILGAILLGVSMRRRQRFGAGA
jgi:hypothetical protein